ncbi:MAG: ATPase P [Chloroflexi bacterium]|nr:ATPase P [Chloroflexota bacterium]
MIELDVPGRGRLSIENAVFDVNGTLAEDGAISENVLGLLIDLAAKVPVHLLTADTYGTIRSQVDGSPLGLTIVVPPGEAEQKAGFVRSLGAGSTAVFGNGANDIMMFEGAALSVMVFSKEGCHGPLAVKADVLVPSSESAVELLLNPKRLIATLRF